MFSSTFRGRKDREKEEEEKERNKKKAESRELNPNLSSRREREPVSKSSGSAAWLRKAFKRAEERARDEGRSIEDVARERWGSLEAFYELLDEAEGSRKSESSPPRRRRRSRDRSPHYSGKEFRKPRDEESSRSRNSHSRGSWKTEERRERDDERRNRDSSKRETPIEEDRPKKPVLEKESQKKETPIEETCPKTPATGEESPKKMSQEELNAIGAKIVKAEILGNNELANKLKRKLEKAKAAALDRNESNGEEQVVILTKTDSRGNVRPVSSSVASAKESENRRRNSKHRTHGSDGNRDNYFPDDDKYDLKRMFEREKSGTAEDQNQALSRLAGRCMKEKANEDHDLDDIFMTRAAKSSTDNDEANERNRAIAEHKSLSKTLDNCDRCLKSQTFAKYLVIATGQTCYLALPSHLPLNDGHCYIVPAAHVSCGVQCDEDVIEEISNFKRALVNMFREKSNSDVVFFETVMRLKRHPHMVIEAVPIPDDDGEDVSASAAIYFQKAIQECESEWSMNKKLIKLGSKSLRQSVPKGLPYFHVDFGLENGFAHVIEDEDEFPKNFAHEIIGGMLSLDHHRWKTPKREKFEDQRNRVLKFGELWQNYDFTRNNS